MKVVMRGGLVVVSLPGDFGKPRPALVVQSDLFVTHPSVTVLPISGTLVDAPFVRFTLQPDAHNGLRKPSQIMLDKISTIRREKIGATIGCLDEETMQEVEKRLLIFLGFA